MLGAVGAAVGILFNGTFPTTPDSFLSNTTPHFPDTLAGAVFSDALLHTGTASVSVRW